MTEFYPVYGGPFINKMGQASPYETLKSIIEEMMVGGKMPPPSETERAFIDAMRADENLAEACFRYAHANYRSSIERLMPPQGRKQKPPPATKKIKQRHRVVKEESVKLLLDHVTPNGKPLRECTFAEVAVLGKAYARLATAGAPNQIVGKVFRTDKQLLVFAR